MHQLKKLYPVVKGEMYQLQPIIWNYQYVKLVSIDYE